MTAGTVTVIVAIALLCAALALAVTVLASIAALVGVLPARTSRAGELERDTARNVNASHGGVPRQHS